MPRAFVLACLVSLAASCAAADEFVVFKKQSRYRGAGLRVESVELDKQGRLLLHGTAGELYSASPDDVDWDLSRRYTERMLETQRQAEADEEERERERAQATLAAKSEANTMSVLEASALFGVENPSFIVTDESSVHRAKPRPSAAGAGGGEGGGSQDPAAKALSAKVKNNIEKTGQVQAEIEALRSETSTDPVSVKLRESRLRSKELQLRRLRDERSALAEESSKQRAQRK